MTDDAICPALDDAGRRCQRWNQPAAHAIDNSHQNGRRRWPYQQPSPIDVDLFAGPGGMDEGRRGAGHDTTTLLGLEWEPWACRTARAAGHVRIRANVATFPCAHLRGRVRLLMGAPPCPTFSMAGKGAGRVALDLFVSAIARILTGDDVRDEVRRRHRAVLLAAHEAPADGVPPSELDRIDREVRDAVLVLEPARWIAETEPESVVLEQVPAVLPIWQALARELRARGWSAWAGILNAADYGVPQTRRRAILIASRVRKVGPPSATHAERPAEDLFGAELQPWVSMAAALGWDGVVGFPRRADADGEATDDGYRVRDWRPTDRPAQIVTEKARSWELRVGAHERSTRRPIDEPAGTLFSGHRCNDVSWVVRTGNNSMVTGRAGSRAGDGDVQPYERPITEPAPTLDTRTGGKWTIDRPSTTDDRAGTDAVRITVAEAATLQGFPSGYPWQGSRTRQFEQVGNAVPPPLAATCVTAALGPALPLNHVAARAAPALKEST